MDAHIELHHRRFTGGCCYDIHASGSGDDPIAVRIVGRNCAGETLTDVAIDVPPDDLPAVADVVSAALSGLVALTRKPAPRSSSPARGRTVHPNVGARWTADDDARLVARHRAGATVEELVQEFGRNRGGIRARLVHLGELPPEQYPLSVGNAGGAAA